jgi:hypothetical protein
MRWLIWFRRGFFILILYAVAILEGQYLPRYGIEWMLTAIGATAGPHYCGESKHGSGHREFFSRASGTLDHNLQWPGSWPILSWLTGAR